MRKYLSIVVLAGWIGLVLYLSYQNGQETANTSREFTEYILHIFIKTEPDGAVLMLWDGRFRTAAHFVLFFFYGVISVPILKEWFKSSFMVTGLAVISGILLAVLSEEGKVFIAGRHCDYSEMGLNVAGVVTGVAIALLFRWLWCRCHKERLSEKLNND